MSADSDLRRAVRTVALLNLAYFGVELAVALRIGSVSLLADSADFFEDAAVNLLVLAALNWAPASRARLGMAMSAVLLIPAAAFLITLVNKLAHPTTPDAAWLSLTGLGALAVNLSCAFLLARHRAHKGSITQAAFLSARNDAVANVAIIAAGGVTALTGNLWPDVVAGLGIAALNLDAAREVWEAARGESAASSPEP